MREIEHYNHIPGQAIEEASNRICLICHSPLTMDELKKGRGAWIPAGASLRFSVHQSCLNEINTAIENQKQQEQEAYEAANFVQEIASLAQTEIRKHR